MLEVELKLPVSDAEGLVARIEAEQGKRAGAHDQHDTYFAHPARDLQGSDEAFRLRREAGRFELTYKGPRRDAAAKVREEINVPVGADPVPLLEALGFQASADVRKHRRTWDLDGLSVAVDDVEGLGTFVEIEAPDGQVDDVHAVARRLGLDPGEADSRSYVEMLADR